MFEYLRKRKERKLQEQQRLEEIAKKARREKIDRAYRKISQYPDDEILIGAKLQTMRDVDSEFLGKPYYEELHIRRRSVGWERYSAAGMKEGFVRTYDLHGKTVGFIKQMLSDREVEKAIVKFEYHTTGSALLAYARDVYG